MAPILGAIESLGVNRIDAIDSKDAMCNTPNPLVKSEWHIKGDKVCRDCDMQQNFSNSYSLSKAQELTS
jgi:hypothetical protein